MKVLHEVGEVGKGGGMISLWRGATVPAAAAALALAIRPPAMGERAILVSADAASAAETRAAADALAEEGAPLLRALVATQSSESPVRAPAPEADPSARDIWRAQGLNHIVLLGTPSEGAAAARTMGTRFGVDEANHELFSLGFGRFRGDVGFVECRPNPWLWSDRFDDNPFTTVFVRIGGTTPRGVALAARAFSNGMLNGIVLGTGARRVETSILDRDPDPTPPPLLPERIGDLVFAGWSQPPENEARAFLDWGASAQPLSLWRVKYLAPGALETGSGAAWTLGPSALAWGNAALLAHFGDAADPSRVLAAMRTAPGAKEVPESSTRPSSPDTRHSSLVTRHSSLTLPMPADENNPALPGFVSVRTFGRWLVISTLPPRATGEILDALPVP